MSTLIPGLTDLESVTITANGSITAASSSCTAQSCVWIVVPTDYEGITVKLTGAFGATLQFEVSWDGNVWLPATAVTGETSTTFAGTWNINLNRAPSFRVRASSFSSGPVHVNLTASILGFFGADVGGGAGGFIDPTTTKGDLIARGPTAPPTRLGVGANGQVLTADSTQPLGMKWTAPSGGGGGSTTIQDEGVALTPRGALNFVGSGVTATDDPANNRITVTVSGGSAAAGGPAGAVQVNTAGAITGYAGLTYDGTTLAGGQIQSTCINPTVGNDPNNRRAWDLTVTADCLNTNPTFSDSNAIQLTQYVTGGYYSYDSTTQAKSTTIPLNVYMGCQGASQAFGIAVRIKKDGMGDVGAWNGYVSYRGGPLTGDEGQCFQCVTYLMQDSQIITRQIVAVARATCPSDMHVTQAVSASKDPQTVNVSGTAGLVAGNWLVAGQSAIAGEQHIRAVQVIAVTSTTLTAVIAVNMASGDPLKPALVLSFNVSGFGQLIPIVNLSGATYSTGTVASITFGGFNGAGTTWGANMVGGDPLNIGAVALVADNDTETPFDATPPESGGHMLRSWYQIYQVTNATQLWINSYSVAADSNYRGNGPGSGAYLIKPAARALWFPDGGTVVCEYSPHVWNVGDIVESTVCPYPDVSLQQWQMGAYTPGGTYRGGISIMNNGHRSFLTGFNVSAETMSGGNKPWGWNTGVFLAHCKTGVSIQNPKDAAIRISAFTNTPSYNGNIIWSGVGDAYIGTAGNQWQDGQLRINGGASNLDFCTSGFTGEYFPEIRWGGNLTLYPPNAVNQVFLQLGYDYGTLAELVAAMQAAPTVSPAPLARLRKVCGWRLEAEQAPDKNLYFHFIDDANTVDARCFALTSGESGPGSWQGAMLVKRGTATASQNFGSYELIFESSIWHAGAAQQQYATMRVEPESNAADAHNRFCIYIWDTAGGNAYQPLRPLSVNDVGKLSIGNASPFSGGGFSATFDPTGLTANRTLTLPNASGLIALADGPSAFIATVPAAVGDSTVMGSFDVSSPPYAISFYMSVSATDGAVGGCAKTYVVSSTTGTGGWVTVPPLTSDKDTVVDFDLDVNMAHGGTLALRLRKVGGTAVITVRVTFSCLSPSGLTWTPAPSTSTTGAPGVFLTSTVVGQSDGRLRLPTYTSSANNFATDAAAATGGVPLGGVYHNAGALRVRVV